MQPVDGLDVRSIFEEIDAAERLYDAAMGSVNAALLEAVKAARACGRTLPHSLIEDRLIVAALQVTETPSESAKLIEMGRATIYRRIASAKRRRQR